MRLQARELILGVLRQGVDVEILQLGMSVLRPTQSAPKGTFAVDTH